MANQVIMRSTPGSHREAIKLYREALKLDETSVPALTGIWFSLVSVQANVLNAVVLLS